MAKETEGATLWRGGQELSVPVVQKIEGAGNLLGKESPKEPPEADLQPTWGGLRYRESWDGLGMMV